jgi:putative photosynthetic complex assembly protein 2
VIAGLVVLLAWWLSTGLVLGLVWQPERRHRGILAAASVLGAAAAFAALWSSREATVLGAYVGFAASLMLWAWHELAFLLGIVTGPNKGPCPAEAHGWTRFVAATATLIHHEVALASTLALLTAATWASPNHVAAGTFAVLWTMRLSSKLNLFLGVRNVTVEFVPEKLRHLVTYFGRRRSNPLMPIALAGSSCVLALLVDRAVRTGESPHAEVAATLLATLLALAVLEHLFLCMPLSEAALWRWALPGRIPTTKREEP